MEEGWNMDVDEWEGEAWGDDNIDAWEDEQMEEPSQNGDDDAQQLTTTIQRKINYDTIQTKDIAKRLEERVKEFGEMMGIGPPYEDARLILQYFDWNAQKATTQYFMNSTEGATALCRINAGIDAGTSDVPFNEGSVYECPVCLDDFDASKVASLTCGHSVCKECWSDYVKESAKSRSCFRLKCPMEDCEVAATKTRLVQLGINPQSLKFLEERQEKFRLLNFVSSCRDLQQCLGPNCTLIQRFFVEKRTISDVQCDCGYIYCVRCLQPGHRPCPCDVAGAWVRKATSEAENMQWILARTKKCPKCRVPIEKNQGCNHMTCRNCKHEFCWLCKGDWKDHGSATGGFYKCNIYETNKTSGKVSTEEKAQRDAKSELERYSFYFTRYDNHIRAISQMKKTFEVAESKMGALMSEYKWKPNEASFIKDASVTIQDCRKLLAWTYPIGYYMDESFQLRDLFHQYQKDLEVYTEHLHELAEQPLEVFRDNDKRAEVINYQRVIQKHRRNLISAIENEIIPQSKFVGILD